MTQIGASFMLCLWHALSICICASYNSLYKIRHKQDNKIDLPDSLGFARWSYNLLIRQKSIKDFKIIKAAIQKSSEQESSLVKMN